MVKKSGPCNKCLKRPMVRTFKSMIKGGEQDWKNY